MSTERKPLQCSQTSPAYPVVSFYENFNKGRISQALEYVSKDVVYHDMNYTKPFTSIQTLQEYLVHAKNQCPVDLEIIIDKISQQDQQMGAQWHLKYYGYDLLKFSGNAFFKVGADNKLTYACLTSEPGIKFDSSIFMFLSLLAASMKVKLVKNTYEFISRSNIQVLALYALYIGYLFHVLLNPYGAGGNVFNQGIEDIKPFLKVSSNVYFLNEFASYLNLTPIPVYRLHPVYEAVFNLVFTWAGIFLPFMLSDYPSQNMRIWPWWLGGWLGTNFFYIPYFAQRAKQFPNHFDFQKHNKKMPGWGFFLGFISLLISIAFTVYFFLGQEKDFNLSDRYEYFWQAFNNDKVFNAIVYDCGLFYLWQFIIMDTPLIFKAIPLFGPCLWLIAGGEDNNVSRNKKTM